MGDRKRSLFFSPSHRSPRSPYSLATSSRLRVLAHSLPLPIALCAKKKQQNRLEEAEKMKVFNMFTQIFYCARQGTCTSQITRILKALTSQASPLTRHSLWDCFTSRPRVTWCLLPFSCSSNQATLTQYGLLEIRNMIGYWQRCGCVTLTIMYNRYFVTLSK